MKKTLSCIVLGFFFSLTAYSQITGPTHELIVPVAGDVDGANGTHFRSDITVTNFRDGAQKVLFKWLPASATGAPQAMFLTIPAHSTMASEDFIPEHLQSDWRLGALHILGITVEDDGDPDARLVVTQRIWTQQAGSNGTTSQSVAVIDVSQLRGGAQAIITGQRIDTRFRTNAGIVNLDRHALRTFDIYQSTDDPTLVPVVTTVTVPPMSMQQVSLKDFRSEALQITVVARPDASTMSAWIAYASSVDNITGDAWSNVVLPR